VAAEGVEPQKHHAGADHQRAQADAEALDARSVDEDQALVSVVNEADQERQRQVQEVAMQVLNDQR
jgi:hypothetical protein